MSFIPSFFCSVPSNGLKNKHQQGLTFFLTAISSKNWKGNKFEMSLLARSKDGGLELLNTSQMDTPIKINPLIKSFSLCKEGSLVAVLSPDNKILIYQLFGDKNPKLTGQIEMTLPVLDIKLSPSGEFITICEKVDLSQAQYRFFKLVTGAQEIKLERATLFPLTIHKESTMGFYTGNEFICRAGRTGLLRVNLVNGNAEPFLSGQQVTDFFVNDAHKFLVAFKRGNPSKCQVISLHSDSSLLKILAERQFFKADSVIVSMHPSEEAFLLTCQTDSDATGKSYYGESQLFLYSNHKFTLVQLDKPGPVHDAAWNPRGREFVVSYGFMPGSRVALIDDNCSVIYTFNVECPVNTINFSSHGSLILFGGFGNLSGKLEIWSRPRCRRLLSLDAPGATKVFFIGEFLVAATLTPRLRVDNGIKFWNLVTGDSGQRNYQELYNVVPIGSEGPDDFERLLKPKSINTIITPQVTATGGARYVPPSLRGSLSPASPPLDNVSALKQALDSNLPHIDNRPKPSKDEVKVKRLEEKLDQIADLKDRKARGEKLELNQEQKIASESQLRQEILELKNKK